MTNEEAGFQAALDADSSDWTCRAAFSDWLRDRGDSRADGYAKLAELQLWPAAIDYYPKYVEGEGFPDPVDRWIWGTDNNSMYNKGEADWNNLYHKCILKDKWFRLIISEPGHATDKWSYHSSRLLAEEAAVAAYMKLNGDIV